MTEQRTIPIAEWRQAIEQARQAGQEASLHQAGGPTARWVIVTATGHVLVMRS